MLAADTLKQYAKDSSIDTGKNLVSIAGAVTSLPTELTDPLNLRASKRKATEQSKIDTAVSIQDKKLAKGKKKLANAEKNASNQRRKAEQKADKNALQTEQSHLNTDLKMSESRQKALEKKNRRNQNTIANSRVTFTCEINGKNVKILVYTKKMGDDDNLVDRPIEEIKEKILKQIKVSDQTVTDFQFDSGTQDFLDASKRLPPGKKFEITLTRDPEQEPEEEPVKEPEEEPVKEPEEELEEEPEEEPEEGPVQEGGGYTRRRRKTRRSTRRRKTRRSTRRRKTRRSIRRKPRRSTRRNSNRRTKRLR